MGLFDKLKSLVSDDKKDTGTIEIVAPLSGEIVNIEDVPDVVFAEKIVGDGIAIKPTGNKMVAPVDGTIGKIFETNHAFSIESDSGIELFVHFGIDTVELKGEGFKRIAEEGQRVKVGDPVIEFDLPLLEEKAKSTLTPVVISNMDEINAYKEESAKKSDFERTEMVKEKTGVRIQGVEGINPVNGKNIPIFVSDYVLMGYGTGASGAQSSKIPGALSTYFGYDKGMAYLQRDCYGINQWEEIIYNELAAKRPVLYDGISNLGQDNQVGHEFVCDGYRDGYYHINWGWSGMSDGYFKLTALDPGSQGTGGGASGFNYGQGAIVGIKKAEEGSKAPIMFYMGENWEVTPETSSRNTNTALTFTGFYNYSTETYNVVYGLKLVNASGNASYIKSNNYKNSMEAGYGYSTYEINSNQITVTGSYKVYPAVYIEDTKTWHDVLMPIYNTPYLNLTATPATLSFSEPDIASDFTISDMKLETPLFYNTTFTITANVENRGREYYDFISAALLRTGTNNVLAQSESMLLDVPANETMKLNYTSKFTDKLMAGTYDLVLLSSDGEIISARLPVEYSTASTEITINDFKLANENASSVPMNDIRFTGSLTCKSGFFNNVLTVALFASGSNSSVAAFNTDPITAKAGETVTFTATGSFLNGTVGSTYLAYLFQNSTQLTRTKVSFTLAKPLGIDDITDDGGCTLYPNPAVDNVTISADSPITSVELFTLNGSQAMNQAVNGSSTSIDLNVSSLPQGIYIVRIVAGNKTITKRLIKQ